MDLGFFLKGAILGFSIAAPVGPIGVLCIRRSMAEGRVVGLVSGLGAATADAIYGAVAAFGLTFVSALLVSQQLWLRIIGGAFLCYLGIKTFLTRPSAQPASTGGAGLAGAYTSTLFLTLTNPTTILSFAAIFAGLGVATAGGGYLSAGLLVLGVFAGSALWWLILSGIASALGARFSAGNMRWVNRLSGVTITAFGVLVLGSLVLG
jgi:threonine/homoserine/homoserine lactone efflux protein